MRTFGCAMSVAGVVLCFLCFVANAPTQLTAAEESAAVGGYDICYEENLFRSCPEVGTQHCIDVECNDPDPTGTRHCPVLTKKVMNLPYLNAGAGETVGNTGKSTLLPTGDSYACSRVQTCSSFVDDDNPGTTGCKKRTVMELVQIGPFFYPLPRNKYFCVKIDETDADQKILYAIDGEVCDVPDPETAVLIE